MSRSTQQNISGAATRASGGIPAASQGLTWLWQHVRDESHPRILDCGPASPATLRVLLARGAKLYISDLITPLFDGDGSFWDRTGKTAVFLTSNFLGQLPSVPDGKLTAILSWNLLDLVPHEALPTVIDRLFSLLEPLGVLFCTLREPRHTTGVERKWWLESLATPQHEPDDRRTFPYPPITNRAIEQLLPGASIKTFLTRSGRREILAMRPAVSSSRGRASF